MCALQEKVRIRCKNQPKYTFVITNSIEYGKNNICRPRNVFDKVPFLLHNKELFCIRCEKQNI